MTDTTGRYSIVIPVYYNEGCLVPLTRTLKTVVLDANKSHRGEIIFVDDGSGDGSLQELRSIQAELSAEVRIIKLTRNFGQHGALLAGYAHAKGDCVITISADGQEPPEMVNEMLTAFFEENYEIVIAARAGRDESLYRTLTSHLFYYLMRKVTFKNMPKGGFDSWLMGRRALETFNRNSEAHSFLPARVLWMGFRTKFITYRRRERLTGVSRWTFANKFTVLLDGLMGYSVAPIRLMSFLGCVFSLLGFVYAGLIMIDTLHFGNPVKGWAPLMIVVLLVGGFQMVILGIIGEYLWRTLAQVRGRDAYVVDAIYEAGGVASQPDSKRPGSIEL